MMPYVGRPGDRITGFCFTNPDDRERFRKLVAYTAYIFDEVIFDDLFIFNCQCELCQKAKGTMSWTEYRLKVMKEVGENLVVRNARSVNPKIHLIFKPPNWYEQYQFSGYNLESQPKVFDMLYAGTETRDAENTLSSTFILIRATVLCATSSTLNPVSSVAAGLIPVGVER